MSSNEFNDLKESINNVAPKEITDEANIPLKIQLQKRAEEVDKKNLKHKALYEVKPLDTSFLESESPNYTDSVSSERKAK